LAEGSRCEVAGKLDGISGIDERPFEVLEQQTGLFVAARKWSGINFLTPVN